MTEPTPEEREAWDLAQIRQRKSRLAAKPIGGAIRRLMASSGYGETQAIMQLEAQWSQAVGPELAKLSRPGNLAGGTLLVHVANSATMQEIHFRKKQILVALQSQPNSKKISDLKIRVGKIN